MKTFAPHYSPAHQTSTVQRASTALKSTIDNRTQAATQLVLQKMADKWTEKTTQRAAYFKPVVCQPKKETVFCAQRKAVAQLGKKTKEETEQDKINRILARFPRRHFLTRIIRIDQLARPNIGINSVRTSRRSLNRNLPPQFCAHGKGKNEMSRLYTYMRKFGGAGYQGFHRLASNMTRSHVVGGILRKMASDKNRTSSSAPKFAIIATHKGLLNKVNTFDFKHRSVREKFENSYPNFKKMYNNHRSEGVVAINGDISLDNILALRAFRGVPSEEELEALIEQLLDEATNMLPDEEPSFSTPSKRRDFDDNGNAGGGQGIGAY